MGGEQIISNPLNSLKKYNFSHNNANKFGLDKTPSLTHLDVSNNQLTELDLRKSSPNLMSLDCSNNPLNNGLNLTNTPQISYFNCLGIKFDNLNNTPSPTSPISATETVFVNNSQTVVGLAVPLGISMFG